MLSLCSLLFASGFHTFALQSYGWSRMFNAYSESMPAADAIALTFSGLELCGVCLLTQELSEELADSLEYAFTPKSTLATPSVDSGDLAPPAAKPVRYGRPLARTPQEIVLEFEPPPPRRA